MNDLPVVLGRRFFDNGYGISVIQGGLAHTSGPDEYEAAVLIGNEKRYKLCYDTPITEDVLGYLSRQEVHEVENQIKALPRRITK